MNVFVNTDRAVLAAMIFAVLFGQVVIYPGVPELVAALGATTTLDASMWFLAAEYAGAVLCAGVWGALSDTAGRRVPFIVAGALGGVASYATLIGLGEVTSIGFGMLLVLRFIGGSFTIGAFSLGGLGWSVANFIPQSIPLIRARISGYLRPSVVRNMKCNTSYATAPCSGIELYTGRSCCDMKM